jgi:hypothetical protein
MVNPDLDPTWPKCSGSDRIRIQNTACRRNSLYTHFINPSKADQIAANPASPRSKTHRTLNEFVTPFLICGRTRTMRHLVIKKKQHCQYLVRCVYQRWEATGRGECQDDHISVAVELVYSVYSIIGKFI